MVEDDDGLCTSVCINARTSAVGVRVQVRVRVCVYTCVYIARAMLIPLRVLICTRTFLGSVMVALDFRHIL